MRWHSFRVAPYSRLRCHPGLASLIRKSHEVTLVWIIYFLTYHLQLSIVRAFNSRGRQQTRPTSYKEAKQ